MAPKPPNPNSPFVKARRQTGLDQQVAAKKIGIAPNSLGRYERGERAPGHALLVKMAKLYLVDVNDLMPPASVPRDAPAGTVAGPVTPPVGPSAHRPRGTNRVTITAASSARRNA